MSENEKKQAKVLVEIDAILAGKLGELAASRHYDDLNGLIRHLYSEYKAMRDPHQQKF